VHRRRHAGSAFADPLAAPCHPDQVTTTTLRSTTLSIGRRRDVEHGLDTELIVVIAASFVAWTLVSARLERLDISAPMAFVLLGVVLANEPLTLIDVDIRSETLRSIAEVSLALLLFSDAARVDVGALRRDADLPVRLLLVGLPLTIGLATVLAMVLFPDLNPWAAAAIAASVAPTDAALGAQVVEDRHVPTRIRRVLSVESGLNDGIATPFVTFFIAGAVSETVAQSSLSLGGAATDLLVGVVAGVAIGLGGAMAHGFATRTGWAALARRGTTVMALALLSYAAAIELGGNGFIAAFVGGLGFGALGPAQEKDASLELDAQAGELLSLLVWFLFGTVVVSALDATSWNTIAFAMLALTLVRMLPVALALTRTGSSRSTVAFLGWFGPRGLASIVFGLIAFDSLTAPDAEVVIAAVALTVLLSVVAHGISARPLARRYGSRSSAAARVSPSPLPR
jgi:NhaP-type Na+/H+ or K+/H+ antiporter